MLFKNVNVDGLNIFYREAGNETAPKLVLLHGFPASSHQYRNLMPALADRFHVIAPDYPGFGNSDMPDPAKFAIHLTRHPRSSKRFSEKSALPASDCMLRTTAGRWVSVSSKGVRTGWNG
jgi:pimeloyl-ACP methyl ester carboxylesterase